MTAAAAPYRKPWWLPGGHCETIAARWVGPRPSYRRQLAHTSDDDPVVFDMLPGEPGKPGICIFHGLEGCSQSHTVRQTAAHFSSNGWSVVVPHFRSCGVMNKLPRAYHAGDTRDVDWMLRYAHASMDDASAVYALGVSLGGNALAKWLAEHPSQRLIAAAATVAAPLDLTACAARLDSWVNRNLYGRHFLTSLRRKVIAKLKRYPFLAKRREIEQVRTLRDFDALYTAPVHGFASADDYYRRSSALPLLGEVRTPLLLLHSANDALVPVPAQPPAGSAAVIECTAAGGHAGYVSGPFPGHSGWLAARIEQFCVQA